MKGRLPFGPFDAGWREPFKLEVEIRGRTVRGARLRTGLARTGIELGFEGVELGTALQLVPRICERSSIAHAVAFCQALENAGGLEVPEGPSASRVILAEYERVASHLQLISDLGRALEDDAVYMGPMRYISRIRGVFEAASGNPFGFGAILPGGVGDEFRMSAFADLEPITRALKRDTAFWGKKISLSRRRLLGAEIAYGTSEPEPPPAPAFRASGFEADLRAGESAYGFYRQIAYRPVSTDGGRTLDRARQVLAEVRASLDIVRQVGDSVKPASGRQVEVSLDKGKGTGICESPEGAIEHRVFLGADGKIMRNRVSCAAERVAELAGPALIGMEYDDLVPALVSFYLCAACIDR